MNRTIKKRLEAIANEDALAMFSELCQKLFSTLQLNSNSEQVAFIAPAQQPLIGIEINNHLALAIRKKKEIGIGFLIQNADVKTISATVEYLQIKKTATHLTSLIYFDYNELSERKLQFVVEKWLSCCAMVVQNGTMTTEKNYIHEDLFHFFNEADAKKLYPSKNNNTTVKALVLNPNIPLNQILFGAPGTGKTYHAINKALEILGISTKNKTRVAIKQDFDACTKAGHIVFTTFHQGMTYEDFIEGIKPQTNAAQNVYYTLEQGIFKQIVTKAACEYLPPNTSTDNLTEKLEHIDWDKINLHQPVKPYVLIIDEINRGNVAAIFGELITLLEASKRLGRAEALRVTLPYSKASFGVPPNLYIIGTMNTADRSVEALDTAMRRRFVFREMLPDTASLSHIKLIFDDNSTLILSDLLHKINHRISSLLGRDQQIGHTYFLDADNWQKLNAVFYDHIIPLLQEYFYGDYGKIGLILGEGFIQKSKTLSAYAKIKGYELDFERPVFDIVMNDENTIQRAIKQLLGENE